VCHVILGLKIRKWIEKSCYLYKFESKMRCIEINVISEVIGVIT